MPAAPNENTKTISIEAYKGIAEKVPTEIFQENSNDITGIVVNTFLKNLHMKFIRNYLSNSQTPLSIFANTLTEL